MDRLRELIDLEDLLGPLIVGKRVMQKNQEAPRLEDEPVRRYGKMVEPNQVSHDEVEKGEIVPSHATVTNILSEEQTAATGEEAMLRKNDELERLAALEHDQWVSWAREKDPSHPLINVPYAQLSEVDKEKDRKWARRALELRKAELAEAAAKERAEHPWMTDAEAERVVEDHLRLEKQAKVYIEPGERPPEGEIAQRGPRGGVYYTPKQGAAEPIHPAEKERSVSPWTPERVKEKTSLGKGGGIWDSKTRVVVFDDDTKVVYKYQTKEEKKELLAYRVGEILGGLVPRVDVVDLKDGEGSAMAWVDGKVGMEFGQGELKELGMRPEFLRRYSLICVMDVVLMNIDRHAGNWIVDREGRPWAIDNGYAFFSSFRRPSRPECSGRRGFQFFDSLTIKERAIAELDAAVEYVSGLIPQINQVLPKEARLTPEWLKEAVEHCKREEL